jgi:hypothetical protein
VALASFAVVFARAARRFGWPATLAVSWTAVLVVDVALFFVRVAVPVALALTLLASVVAMRLMPRTGLEDPVESVPPPWDLLGRAVMTGILVVTLTTASGLLGPRWTGLLAPFPIATSVVAAFVHARQGSVVTERTLAGTVVGLFGFATFCVSVAVLLRPIGGAAFVVGAAMAVAVQLLVVTEAGRPASRRRS